MADTAQPALAGFDETVQTPAPPDVLPRIALHGVAAEPARVRHTADGVVLVEVLLEQRAAHHPRAVRVLVVFAPQRDAGFARTYEDATRLAARLSAGAEVVAIGRGLEPRHHHGAEVLRLIRCDALGPVEAAAAAQPGEPAHEPA